jgi:alpha-glucosidase
MIMNPHHDGSRLHVGDPAPSLGDTVDVFVRVPRGYSVDAVHVRSTPDAEPHFDAARIDRTTEHETWWRASLRMANPDTHYRFLLDRGPHGYSWLTGTGVHDRDVPDDRDFRLSTHDAPPAWAAESVIYQIFPDRFASSGEDHRLPSGAVSADWYDDPVIPRGTSAERQFYGGDLPGIQAHLEHIESLGVNTVYLTPFFTSPSNHRYNASDFTQVDPMLGGNQALATLTERLHQRGIRVVGDLTTNHTGSRHPWFEAAQRDPSSAEAGFYYWREEDPGYLGWLDVPTLPKLNWDSDELRRRMIDGNDSIVARWLQPPYNLDGWRIDVANMTARHASGDRNHAVARAIRAAMVAARPDALLIAEHGHDYTRDVDGDGWHGSMNYAAFTRPVWRWLADPATTIGFLGMPVPVRRGPGTDVVATMTDFLAAIPWQARATNMNLLSSHDTPRIRTVTGDPGLVEVGAVLLVTLPGIPTIFAGDEIGLEGVNGEDARRPFPWKQPERWDARTLQAYRSLVRLRRNTVALQHGGLRWVHVGDDTLAFLRETAEERVLVVASRAAGTSLVLPRSLLGVDAEIESLYGDAPSVDAHGIRVPDGPGAHVWRLGR